MSFKEKMDRWSLMVNEALKGYVPEGNYPYETVMKAMRYSLMAGGKRIRPVLALAVNEIFGGREEDILPVACAIEMIHTYSLIHDDLPAMDNDDYRRGRPTNHKVFGEGMAVLAGDALLNTAFELMIGQITKKSDLSGRYARAVQIVADASGTAGMIGGQVIDLESENKKIGAKLLHTMHRCKTGALIKAPVRAAAIICGASPDEYEQLDSFAENLGLAFQIKDDILDVEGCAEKLGKSVGSDENNQKSTFITLYGLEASKTMLEQVSEKAVEALAIFEDRAGFLKDLTEYLVKREN